ncbi:MAG: formylglycine-generating enzyme family protein [Deltaproteobacteria bacterium]|nr:formylglycine-generating enzyme family protein [Deltaproteobacteria bacterium]
MMKPKIFLLSLLMIFMVGTALEQSVWARATKGKSIESPSVLQMPFSNLQQQFVLIPKGSFMMGSPAEESGFTAKDEAQHLIVLTENFEIMKTEVTQLMWFKFTDKNPSHFKEKKYCPKSHTVMEGVSLCPDHPVEQVSWNDVKQFIDLLNYRLADGYRYRLPSEAEWEYAARGGGKDAFYFGKQDEKKLKEYGWFWKNAESKTHPIGSCPTKEKAKPNKFGLYDVHGNVSEWVNDWYGNYEFHHKTIAIKNPIGPKSGSYRVIRGGCWNNSNPLHLRSASRSSLNPDHHYYYVGFRLVRTKK